MRILDLGMISYHEALSVQEEVLKKRIEGGTPDTLIVLEHFPVVTFGRTFDRSDILDDGFFTSRGFDIVHTTRGGSITCHMPGQIVVYPVIGLAAYGKNISRYIDMLQDAAVSALAKVGVTASGDPGRRGVWVSGKKIAFIGIKVTKWIAYHGIAINFNNDLSAFSRINPCGEPDIKVTSAGRVLGGVIDMAEARSAVKAAFTGVFAAKKEPCGTCG